MATNETVVLTNNRKKRNEVRLSAQEVRGLYYLKEAHVEEILDAAVMLDEQERKLVVRMMHTLLEHRRSQLS